MLMHSLIPEDRRVVNKDATLSNLNRVSCTVLGVSAINLLWSVAATVVYEVQNSNVCRSRKHPRQVVVSSMRFTLPPLLFGVDRQKPEAHSNDRINVAEQGNKSTSIRR